MRSHWENCSDNGMESGIGQRKVGTAKPQCTEASWEGVRSLAEMMAIWTRLKREKWLGLKIDKNWWQTGYGNQRKRECQEWFLVSGLFLSSITREMVGSLDEKLKGQHFGETEHEFMVLVIFGLTPVEVLRTFSSGDVSRAFGFLGQDTREKIWARDKRLWFLPIYIIMETRLWWDSLEREHIVRLEGQELSLEVCYLMAK